MPPSSTLSLPAARRRGTAGSHGVLFAVYAPFGGDPVLSRWPRSSQSPIHQQALVQALSRAAVFSVLAAVSANLATVAWQVPQHAEWSKSPDMPLIVMTGIAESLTPAILGFSLLGIAWFITAFGVRRGGA